VHALAVTARGVQHYHDPDLAGRGLGLSRTTNLRYYQAEFQPNDFILLTANPLESWSEAALQSAYGQGLESLRRRLLVGAGADLHAAVLQGRPGAGRVQFLKPKATLRPAPGAAGAPAPIAPPPAPASAPQAAPLASDAVVESAAPAAAPLEPAPVERVATFDAPAAPAEPEPAPAPSITTPEPAAPTAPPPGHVTLSKPVKPEPAEAEQADTAAPKPPAAEAPSDQPIEPGQADITAVPAPVEPAPADGEPLERPAGRWLEQPAPPVVEASALPVTAAASKPEAPTPAKSPTPVQAQASAAKRLRPFRAGARQSRPGFNAGPLASAALGLGSKLQSGFKRLGHGLVTLLRRALPDESLLNIPPSVMIFAAVAVPVLAGIIGAMVWINRGKAAQQQQYFVHAAEIAFQARELTSADERRLAYEQVLVELDKADFYVVTSESTYLRQEAVKALDDLDWIRRLDFKPAITGGMADTIRITRMAATTSELYMLNQPTGSLLRATLTGHGYDMDAAFRCAPGQYGSVIVGALVDLATLPNGNTLDASVVGLDANGNLLICAPGEAPRATPLAPPESNWGQPVALAVDSGDLYVLDPQNNAVWIFRGMDFTNRPRLFFGAEVPFMQDVIDLAVNRDDLYLLHADGQQTLCVFSGLKEAPTRCNQALYTDSRLARDLQSVTQMPRATFSEIMYLPPPDSSLFMLDPAAGAIYHFSVKLTFQRQYNTTGDFPDKPATAFAASPDRVLFIAFDNQVFYAQNP
jgi:hypothetical protein